MDFISTIGRNLSPKNVALGVMVCDMVGRPLITMSNKEIPYKTKKTIAIREFFTELIGATLTYGVATAVEKFVPKFFAKKLFGMDLTKDATKTILESEFKTLSVANQKLRGIILLSSFVGTVLAASILTPLINNFLTNKILNKYFNKADDNSGNHAKPKSPKYAVDDSRKPSGPSFSSSSVNFQHFLQQYQTNKAHAALNMMG